MESKTDVPNAHRAHSGFIKAKVSILTLSDTRSTADDISGRVLRKAAENEGHEVVLHEVIADDADELKSTLDERIPKSDAVITTGGTGPGPRDITVETVEPMLEKKLASFNSLFTQLSHEQVGTACILSRATAGMVGNTAVFCLPGSPKACELAAGIIFPELSHLVNIARG